MDLREIYLKPFELAVKGSDDPAFSVKATEDIKAGRINGYKGSTGMMSSFNRIGTRWTGGDYRLLTTILRNEWGFNGFAITDNANTGSPTYMSANQMIEAGGDGALTTTEYAVWKFEKDNAAHCTYGREAMHHVLYTVAIPR